MRAAFVIALLFLAACSGRPVTVDSRADNVLATAQVPVATGYPLTTQEKMQALHHWDHLASRVASQAGRAMDHFFPQGGVGIFVAPAGSTPFAKSYRHALITHLVGYGVPVAFAPEGNAILEVHTELLAHQRELTRTEDGAYENIEPGFRQRKDPGGRYLRVPIIAEEGGMFDQRIPTTEIQITSSLLHGKSYLYRDSSIFYVNPSEWSHYQHQAPQGCVELKRFSLVRQ